MAKVKVQITLEDELLNAVDEYCDRNYMNRSWLISQSLVQTINQQKLIDSFANLSIAIKNCTDNREFDEKTLRDIQNFEVLCKSFVQR